MYKDLFGCQAETEINGLEFDSNLNDRNTVRVEREKKKNTLSEILFPRNTVAAEQSLSFHLSITTRKMEKVNKL